ncbi:hypothetical protein NM688_g7279 [Phlebia brevispora]|uniref:Uncharacterized protein n=1 Tax=Phlebia brevispora TaxID=194682 RepID=A0ACC1S7L7_9APHY|nr:hypothetical protein NM688_g7279 [Phlebia brevispora]
MSNPAQAFDETSATTYGQETWLQGALLASIAYGIVIILCFQTFVMLVRGCKRSTLLQTSPLFLYVASIFILSSVFQGANMRLVQRAFINNNNSFPGGPFPGNFPVLVNACNYTMVVSTFFSDALLLWRCTVVYKNSAVPDWVCTVLAVTAGLTELIIGVLFPVEIPGDSVYDFDSLVLGLFCYSLVLNVFATTVIAGRILVYDRRRLARMFGDEHIIAQYTGPMTILVESELLYTAYIIMFIVPYILHNLFYGAILQTLALVQASILNLYQTRLTNWSHCKGWTKDTHAQIATAQLSTIRLNTVSRSTRAAQASTVTIREEIGKSTDSGTLSQQQASMGEDGAMLGEA